jgi:hypothetical protein
MENVTKKRKSSDLLKIRQLIRLGKKHSLKRLKFSDIEIEFTDKSFSSSQAVKYEKQDSQYLNAPTLDMPPDDVMLYAATDHFEHLLGERKAAQKR